MAITIDVRESKLIQVLEGNIAFEKAQLDLGDVKISHESGYTIVVERKTLADMAASLKDNRWREQKVRLLNARANGAIHAIAYIIEGSFTFNESDRVFGLPCKTLVSMFLNCMFKDNIFVIQTRTVVETSDAIVSIANRIANYVTAGDKIDNVEGHQEELIKSKKKDNVTNDTVFIMQLCAIPGISHKKACQIASELSVSSMYALIQKLGTDEKQAIKTLVAVKGIGKILAKQIFELLIGSAP